MSDNDERILIVGDIHGNMSALKTLYDAHKPDTIIQCGDFGYFPFLLQSAMGGMRHIEDLKRVECPVYFCDGNHEDFRSLSKLGEDEPPFDIPGLEHVKYMRRGDTYTTRSGENILFLGGANSIDKPYRTPGLDWFPEEILKIESMDRIPDMDIDIVVSHTCPVSFIESRDFDLMINDYEIDPSRDVLELVLRKYSPKKWYFGHWHKRMSGMVDSTHWLCLKNVTSENVLDENCSWDWVSTNKGEKL
jgi:Icc-related predicted phosphoesterase